jgi:hypothetical protein
MIQAPVREKSRLECGVAAVGLMLVWPAAFLVGMSCIGSVLWCASLMPESPRDPGAPWGLVDYGLAAFFGSMLLAAAGYGAFALYESWRKKYNDCRTYWTQVPNPTIKGALRIITSDFGWTTPEELDRLAVELKASRERLVEIIGETPSSPGVAGFAARLNGMAHEAARRAADLRKPV